MNQHDTVRPIRWAPQGLILLDQRELPGRVQYVECTSSAAVADAIRQMVVRGAPAIGIAAADGVVLAAQEAYAESPDHWREALEPRLLALAESRPTAVNLFWALQRMRDCLQAGHADPVPRLLQEARAIQEEDLAANLLMGDLGAALIDGPTAVLTHCNTGSLATAGYGTALGVIRSAYSSGRINRVYADETRPWLQGARLTAWELQQDKIPVTVIADAAAPLLLRRGEVSWVIVGADRIAANGDVANKIGTYGLALAARAHGVKVMVVAPTSTIDWTLDSGDAIPIEKRHADELLSIQDIRLAAEGVEAWKPVFDVTPAEYIDVIVTERGVVRAPGQQTMAPLRNC
jgi:methylthioribose-1-phosphate isomerase